jgi:carbamoyltransferase
VNVLGLSFMYHDSAAALLQDGAIVAASAEERFSRKKHSLDFPEDAVAACLKDGRIGVRDLDAVVFYEKPYTKFERILTMSTVAFPHGYKLFAESIPLWAKYKLHIRSIIRDRLRYEGPVHFVDHHYAHAASSFFASGFEESAILTLDGVGEWATMTRGRGAGTKIELTHELRYPHSMGLLYSALTAYLGFRVNSGEGKVMGLASYGTPRFYDDLMRDVVHVRDDGSFRLNLEYFSFFKKLVMYSEKFVEQFGPARKPESELTSFHEDMAASLQKVTETIGLAAARKVHEETGSTNLCIAGGVGLNSVMNGKIMEQLPFKQFFAQPACGDDGGAIGGALYYWHQVLGRPRGWKMTHALLGPRNDPAEVRQHLELRGIPHRHYASSAELVDRAARDIADGRIVGWVQGRMEYGPRSLGARSILANPRIPGMKDVLNARVKFREKFRPFAPAIPLERCGEYFEPAFDSPYMLLVCRTRADKVQEIPEVTHSDGTARLQTVERDSNPRYYDLITRFGEYTGTPVLLNTSFNIRGEPIVCTYPDAIACFLNTDIDCLALEDCYLVKTEPTRTGGVRTILPPEEWPEPRTGRPE